MNRAGCDFSLEHYSKLLQAIQEGGYHALFFGEYPPPKKRIIYVRHDIDIHPQYSLPMARVEADRGIKATYFFMIDSMLYNLLAPNTISIAKTLKELGHQIGLHLQTPRVPPRFVDTSVSFWVDVFRAIVPISRAISFHRPDSMASEWKSDFFFNAYDPRFTQHYISDSNGVWRDGCPCLDLQNGKWPCVQLLVHPIWWIHQRDVRQSIGGLMLKETWKYLEGNISRFQKGHP